MSSIVVENLRKKLGNIPLAALERKYGIPRNTLFNARYGKCSVPKKYLKLMVDDLTNNNLTKVDPWVKLNPKKIRKGTFPKWLNNLRVFCREENIKVEDLISLYKKVNPKSIDS